MSGVVDASPLIPKAFRWTALAAPARRRRRRVKQHRNIACACALPSSIVRVQPRHSERRGRSSFLDFNGTLHHYLHICCCLSRHITY